LVTEQDGIVLLADEGADYRAMVALDAALVGVKWRREALPNYACQGRGRRDALSTRSTDVLKAAQCMIDGSVPSDVRDVALTYAYDRHGVLWPSVQHERTRIRRVSQSNDERPPSARRSSERSFDRC
jgi:hypothetical protein